MARSEARLQFGCWRKGLDGLGPFAKLVYAVLLTEPTLSHCGVGAIRRGRWAKEASLTVPETEAALQELAAGPLPQVIVDDDTDEVFVRTLIRNDRVADQPYVLKGALREALKVESPRIRRLLAAELRKLPPKQPDSTSKRGATVSYPDPHATADELERDLPPEPTGKGSETLSQGDIREASERVFADDERVPTASVEKGSESPHGGGGGGGGGSPSVGSTSKETINAAAPSKLDEGFDRFWAEWPRKVGKQGAQRAFRTARRRGASIDHLVAATRQHAAAWIAQGTPRQFIPHPATWLNDGRYDDEIENPNQTVLSVVPDLPATFEDIRDTADLARAEQLLGYSLHTPAQPPSDRTPPQQWRHDRAVDVIDAHEAEIRDAIGARRAG